MPGWAWSLVGTVWVLVMVGTALFLGRMIRLRDRQVPSGGHIEEEVRE